MFTPRAIGPILLLVLELFGSHVSANEMWPGKPMIVRRGDGSVKVKVPVDSPHDKREYDPAHSFTVGKIPSKEWLDTHKPKATYHDIQDHECGKNTRVVHTSEKGLEVWAVFRHNSDKNNNQHIMYGLCEAYIDEPPENGDLVPDCGGVTFYWDKKGETQGNFGCIRNPQDDSCGCEASTGRFVEGEYNTQCVPKAYPNGNGDHVPVLQKGEHWVYHDYDKNQQPTGN